MHEATAKLPGCKSKCKQYFAVMQSMTDSTLGNKELKFQMNMEIMLFTTTLQDLKRKEVENIE
jgi:hypothetical protein